MWRYLVGMVAGVLLVAGGVLWWRSSAVAHRVLPDAPQALAGGGAAAPEAADTPEPPQASEKTREEKRFSRYDHDKDGKVSREEFLARGARPLPSSTPTMTAC